MLRTKSFITIGVLLVTVGVWGLLGWRLLLAGGIVHGSLSSSWHGLAKRSAWAHWVNGTPTIRDGVAYLQPGQQFEIAVQPIAVCSKLHFSIHSTGAVELTSRETGEHQNPEFGFRTKPLPRTFDGYHFLLLAKEAQTLSSFTFTCRP